MERSVVWSRLDEFGAEFASVRVEDTRLTGRGVALGVSPKAYRLDYEIETDVQFVTRRLQVRSEGLGWSRRLELTRDGSGWRCRADASGDDQLPPPGGDVEPLSAALDCDVGRSPLTNTMPVLRHGVHRRSGRVDFVMAWVSVPDLGLHRSDQAYEFVRREGDDAVVRFIGKDPPFTADLVFDPDGFVLFYPGLARREG